MSSIRPAPRPPMAAAEAGPTPSEVRGAIESPRAASRVRVAPPEDPSPAPGRIPTARARRWWSPYEGPGNEAYLAIYMTPRAYVRVCAHAGSDLEHEVGGALAGRWRRDKASGRPFIVIEAALAARHTRHGRSFLTFTHDSLIDLHEELEERYPGKLLVGWYHTHPGMDVFLSGYDLWLHEHFFPYPWQVALVVEPHASHGGFFLPRADGPPDPRRYAGFGELIHPAHGSVMRWGNLKPDDDAGRKRVTA